VVAWTGIRMDKYTSWVVPCTRRHNTLRSWRRAFRLQNGIERNYENGNVNIVSCCAYWQWRDWKSSWYRTLRRAPSWWNLYHLGFSWRVVEVEEEVGVGVDVDAGTVAVVDVGIVVVVADT
jgi:hypothetical protein